jgi:hypothetical protein
VLCSLLCCASVLRTHVVSVNTSLTRSEVDMVTKHEDFGMHDNPLRQHKVRRSVGRASQ